VQPKIALLQLNSSNNVEENIKKITNYVNEAAQKGAEIIFTPENSGLMDMDNYAVKDKADSTYKAPFLSEMCVLAQKNNVWLHIGSHPFKKVNDKIANRSYLINNNGDIVAVYDKIHLFDVDLSNGETYRESSKIEAGSEAVVTDTPYGKIGFTICYDLRFPQLHRALAKQGTHIIVSPAAFTKLTGKAHWHILLRSRAIETGGFIIAAAQTGIHTGGRETYGHSLVVNPWGEVILDMGEKEGIGIIDINLDEIRQSRARLPSLTHDKFFSIKTVNFSKE
jgi:predicted amidohydrolase